MIVIENGIHRSFTDEEKASMNAQGQEYWFHIPFADAVTTQIRTKYSAEEEAAIIEQKDKKPEEYQTYVNWCEVCNDYVTKKKQLI